MKQENEKQNSSKASKIINIIVNVLLVLVLIFAFFCTYTVFTTKKGNGVPNLFGNIFLSIQSDSMSPTFEKGDLIISKVVKDPKTLEEGDIITFWTIIEGQRVLNTHRIVKVESGESFTYFYTKGDNNTMTDALTVHESEVVGKYSSKIKGVGTVLDFLQTSKGFLIVIVIPVLAFFIYYLVTFLKTLMEYKSAKNRIEVKKELEEDMDKEDDENITLTKSQLMQLLKQAGVDMAKDDNESEDSNDKK